MQGPQLLRLVQANPTSCAAATREVSKGRGLCKAMREQACSLHLEKAHVQQRRPRATNTEIFPE